MSCLYIANLFSRYDYKVFTGAALPCVGATNSSTPRPFLASPTLFHNRVRRSPQLLLLHPLCTQAVPQLCLRYPSR
jgi:hypothetical protein